MGAQQRTCWITKGLPASGKSTWAKGFVQNNTDYVRINNDSIQNMLFCVPFAAGKSKELKTTRELLISHFLDQGTNIVVDNTHLSPSSVTDIVNLLTEANFTNPQYFYTLRIKDFTDVSVQECLKRDRQRADSVGEAVILDMYNKFLKKETPPRLQDTCLPKAVCFDMDGTLAIMGDRSPYEEEKCMLDTPNTPVCSALYNYLINDYKILIVSGRQDHARAQTEEWLAKYKLPFHELHMRKSKDQRKDSIIKKEIYENILLPKYYIEAVFDDRNQVVEMLRDELGLTVFQVAPGLF